MPFIGPLDVANAAIRLYAKPGEYVVLNDCCLRDRSTAVFPGFENPGATVTVQAALGRPFVERFAAIGSVAIVTGVGGSITALAVVATVGVVLGLMAMISFRRFQQTDMSRTTEVRHPGAIGARHQ